MEIWKIFVSLKNARWSDSSMFKYHFKSFQYILIIVIVCELQLFWPKIMQRDTRSEQKTRLNSAACK